MRLWKRQRETAWEEAFALLREPKTLEELTLDEAAVREALERSPIPVREMPIDTTHYHNWRARADYSGVYPDYYPENIAEKSLEHWFVAQLLQLKAGQRYLDVASQNGVAAEIYERLHGVEGWRQDLAFPPGRRGRTIGGSAAAMDVPDGFFDAMGLHCSFEHFEGEADIAFLAEAGRVLRPGGRCAIAPLYLADRYCCLVDPEVAVRNTTVFEADMLLHAKPRFGNAHCRFYDVAHLVERLWNNRGGLRMEVLVVPNFRAADPSCYLRFALLLEKPA